MPTTKYTKKNAEALGLARIETLDILEERLNDFITNGERQAIIIKITRNGHEIFSGAYGENTKPYGLKPDTIFAVMSLTKPTISTLLMILQEDGLVDLNENIGWYLPEFTGGGRENICLYNFLTHTSGLKDDDIWSGVGEYIAKEYRLIEPERRASQKTKDAYHKKLCKKMGLNPDASENDRMNDPYYIVSLKLDIKYEPRSHMTYCNYGYQKLKEVIDVVTDQPIDEFAQQRLFKPLNMKNTYWNVPESKWDQIIGRGETCMGYPFLNEKGSFQNESGGGGLKSTVEDFTNFGQMILSEGKYNGNQILSRRSIFEMIRNHNQGIAPDNPFAPWALGWNIRDNKKDDSGILRSSNCIDHGGWAGTKIIIDPEEKVTMAIFTVEYDAQIKPWRSLYGFMVNTLYSSFV